MPFHTIWYTYTGYQAMSRYYRKRFCVPTVHPTPSTSPTIEAQINKHLILNICVIDTSFSCRACRGCRVHCRDTKTFPVVPRHGLVSYRGVPVSMVRHKKLLKAPKCLISLITVFFGKPCISVSLVLEYNNKIKKSFANFVFFF